MRVHHRGRGHRDSHRLPEIRLGGAVLWQALQDLCSPSIYAAGFRRDVERWVANHPSRDFRLVCALAGIEPGPVHRRFRELVDMPVRDRARWFAEVAVSDETLRRRSEIES